MTLTSFIQSEGEGALEASASVLRLSGDRQERTVAIFCHPLLAPTHTFIPAQGDAMTRFKPCYVGPKLGIADGLRLPSDRTVVLHSGASRFGRIRELPFRFIGWSPGFFRRVKRLQPVLIHAHFGPAACEAMPLARWLGVPLIANFHGGDATMEGAYMLQSEFYMHRRFWRRRSELASQARLLLACSKFIRSELIRKGFPESSIRVHYVGIDTEFFSANPAVTRESIVLFVGSLAPVKGLSFLIRAMREIQKSHPDAELVVIGDGPLRSEARAMAQRLLSRYRFLGYQSADSVRSWMNRARVLCTPSVRTATGECEGFGLVCAEAQAMELPVVGFATGGIPEAIQDGGTGILGPEGDVAALVRNLTLLLQDEVAWQRMSRSGRVHACKHFDLRRCTSKLEDIYQSVLDSSEEEK